jgi:very-short-patch-repair endonuclease
MILNCSICKDEIKRTLSQLNSISGEYFCSRNCFNLFYKNKGRIKSGIFKNCVICNVSFYVPQVHKEARFCSLKCKGIGSRYPNLVCPICKGSFKYQTNRKYCSTECKNISISKARINRSIKKICDQCNNMFYVNKFRIDARLCSKQCHINWQKENAFKNKTKFICKICKVEFGVYTSIIKHHNNVVKYCSIPCRDADPEVKERLVNMNLQQQNSKTPNQFEIRGYRLLKKLGLKFEKQYLVNNKFCVDAFISKYNLVIQFDGDYWHGNPNKYKILDHRQQKRVNYDKSQDKYMKKCGYKILRFWESDFKDIDKVKKQIKDELKDDKLFL